MRTALTLIITVISAISTFSSSAFAECRKPQALIVQGALTGVSVVDQAFASTGIGMVKDLERRGYQTYYFVEPPRAVLMRYLKDPCVKAFGFVGEGIEEDSANSNVSVADGSDSLFINSKEVIMASDMYIELDQKRFDLVILHACFQGAPNNKARWLEAFNMDSAKNFYSWSGKAHYFEVYWWQYFWK